MYSNIAVRTCIQHNYCLMNILHAYAVFVVYYIIIYVYNIIIIHVYMYENINNLMWKKI